MVGEPLGLLVWRGLWLLALPDPLLGPSGGLLVPLLGLWEGGSGLSGAGGPLRFN